MSYESVYNLVDIIAVGLLLFDFRTKKVAGISLQTFIAIAVAKTILLLKGFYYIYHGIKRFDVAICTEFTLVFLSWGCAMESRKHYDSQSDDVLVGIPVVPPQARNYVLYVLALVMALPTTLAVCWFSVFEWWSFISRYPMALVATYINFLQGAALLPQLLLAQKRGHVPPAMLKFLLLVGTKDIFEFLLDLLNVATHQAAPGAHPSCYLIGDFFTALVLLDFLYLFLKRVRKGDKSALSDGWTLPM